jgi:low temperature requirement protein LtrA
VTKPLRIRMTARDTRESHRAASPLELLFDLTFVVAISQVSRRFAHAAEAGHPVEYIAILCMIFFAIWWAWMNFTWFASAYDSDDVLYRLLVLVQMGGVLVIASGVPAAFDHQDFAAVTIGYLIMRCGLVALWVRAAIEHPEGRRTALRYAIGISVVQALWLSQLISQLAHISMPWWVFVPLAVLDMSVPLWAERTGETAWHPHHIAERFGLFTIILLGEGVLASTLAVEKALSVDGGTVALVGIAAFGLMIVFALWWLYFAEQAGEGLERHRERSFLWGYGHFGIFVSLAAIGSALEVAVATEGEGVHLSQAQVGWIMGIPVSVFLVLLWALHAPIVHRVAVHPIATGVAVVGILLIPLAAPVLGVVGQLAAIAFVLALLLTVTLLWRRERNDVEESALD